MRIMKLTAENWEPMEAVAVKNKKNKLRFSIMHGSFPKRGLNTWGVRFYLKRNLIKGDDFKEKDTIVLKDTNYYVMPLKDKNRENILDKNKNVIYMITESNDTPTLNNHDVVFWYIPLANSKISIEYSGNVREVLRGTYGEEYLDMVYKAPAPVLDVMGDCELMYKYIENGVEYKNVYTYNQKEDKWSRELITSEIKKD